jgi:molybdate transport system substrate-binding protein
LTVSAAADLLTAFTELGGKFEQETGVHVTFNFGSSGVLAQQIQQGAPVDLFASANRSYVDALAARGLILPDTVRIYARGQLVLWTRSDSPLSLKGIDDLTRPEVKRVAIANPEHAPYGVAAREALQNSGIWNAVEPKLVLAENIQQTMQFAATGNVDAALGSLSLAVGSNGHWVVVSPNLYSPIDQALGVVKGARNEREARAFAAFVSSPQGEAVMAKYGFTRPEARSQ